MLKNMLTIFGKHLIQESCQSISDFFKDKGKEVYIQEEKQVPKKDTKDLGKELKNLQACNRQYCKQIACKEQRLKEISLDIKEMEIESKKELLLVKQAHTFSTHSEALKLLKEKLLGGSCDDNKHKSNDLFGDQKLLTEGV